MRESTRKRVAAITALVLAASMLPVQTTKKSEATTKKYTISEKGGDYQNETQTTVKALSGYKVYYTTNGTFTSAKKIKSGASKTFYIKKDTALQLIAVKKSVKVTNKKLNNKLQSKVKTFMYRIGEDVTSPQATAGTGETGQTNPVSTAIPGTTTNPVSSQNPATSATPAASQKPGTTKKPGATATPAAGGNGSTGGNNGGFGSNTSGTVTGLTAISANTTKPAALSYDSSATNITMTSNGSASGTGYKMETADGETVLTIKSAGTYIVSTNGSVTGRIEISKGLGDVTLVLNGVNLTSSVAGDEGVIGCKGKNDSGTGNNLKVILASGTTNTLTSTGEGKADSDDPTDIDYPSGILVKKGSTVTVGGSGTLNINSTNGSGIKVKFNECSTSGDIDTTCASISSFWDTTLTIQDNPKINITCYEGDAAGKASFTRTATATEYDGHQDAISSKNSLVIYGGTLNIKAGDDGIHAEAMTHIVDGTITVSQSEEALEGARVVIDGGTLNLTASDDGINAANGDLTTNTQTGEDVNIFNITINGGGVTVNAEGDGIDSNGNAFITGGTVVVYGPTNGGNGALDVADRTGSLVVSGGTLTATAGTADMAITPSTSGLGFVAFTATTAISANTSCNITDASGNTVRNLTTKKSTIWVLYCGSNVTNGSTYNLVNGSTTVATATAGQGSAGGMGGMPGNPPGDMSGGNNQGGMTPPSDGSGGMTPPSGGNPPGGGMAPLSAG
ncbi:MAG: carbohydrate-binding domain-containing protein [Eubacterium sp.]|nr:carbohydrate-binding domain-containing protein [Eubacterium sp.]